MRRPFSYSFGPRLIGTNEIPFLMLAKLNISKLSRDFNYGQNKALITNIPFEVEEEYVLSELASKGYI